MVLIWLNWEASSEFMQYNIILKEKIGVTKLKTK